MSSFHLFLSNLHDRSTEELFTVFAEVQKELEERGETVSLK